VEVATVEARSVKTMRRLGGGALFSRRDDNTTARESYEIGLSIVPSRRRGKPMKERDLAEQFLRDHVLAARALVALQLNQLPDGIRSRVNQAIANGTGYTELRTRIDTGETELVLVPSDGSEPLWRTRQAP
jgi:hypothetical protein